MELLLLGYLLISVVICSYILSGVYTYRGTLPFVEYSFGEWVIAVGTLALLSFTWPISVPGTLLVLWWRSR